MGCLNKRKDALGPSGGGGGPSGGGYGGGPPGGGGGGGGVGLSPMFSGEAGSSAAVRVKLEEMFSSGIMSRETLDYRCGYLREREGVCVCVRVRMRVRISHS